MNDDPGISNAPVRVQSLRVGLVALNWEVNTSLALWNLELYARKGYGRLVLGRFVHLGVDTALRCHEGTLSLGDKSVLARDVSINCYLDVEIGDCALIADNVYISDFDHKFADLRVPIKDQGIAKSRVRIDRDVWLGTKVTVSRGVHIGEGAVVGANAVVTRDLPAFSVAVGVPARVIKDRRAAL